MPKVLILGLYYPPANFIAGRRLAGWARHLPSFGYEPLVLTRYYDADERNGQDFYASQRATRTLSEPWVEEDGVVYTNFTPSLWNRLPLPGKVRGMGYYVWPDPDHSGWFRQCFKYLREARFKPDLIIGSYGPPGALRVARRLSARLGVPWVADYRDLWIEQFDESFDTRFKYFLQRRHLRSAAGIVVASDAMEDAVRKQLAPLEKPMRLVYNGAEPFTDVRPEASDDAALKMFASVRERCEMVLTYAGTLYPAQEIERFLNTVGEFIERSGRASCAVVLCGRHEREQYARWPFVEVLGPVHHGTALFIQKESTAVFYPTWPDRYSGFSGKLFEQVLTGRPVLVAFRPAADLETLCGRFGSVIIAKAPEELIDILGRLSQGHPKGAADAMPSIATRKYWTGELARFLDELLDYRR
jgi:hypothetical protein